MMKPQSEISTYQEFWPFYLSQHANPWTRRIHVAGTLLAAVLGVSLAFSGHPGTIPIVLVAGYGPAWISHFLVEKNRPATFKYPFWSFISDFRMVYLVIIGKL